MARQKSNTFTPVEMEFMQVIWKSGEVTTDDIQRALEEQGRKLTDGSIRKVLMILVEKGHLTRRREGHGFIYKPTASKQKAIGMMMQNLVNKVFNGSSLLMISALFENNPLKKNELEQIKKLIDKRERDRRL